MIRGIERLAKDMTVRMLRQEAVAANLANATTSGYKTQRTFVSVLKDAVGGAPQADRADGAGLFTDFSQGPIDRTERSLDVALEGDGFFVVDTPVGSRYTRCGNFTLSDDGTLVTQAGHPVLGGSGPITITGDNVVITAEGTIYANNEEIGSIRVVAFDNPQGLANEGNMFASLVEEGRPCDMKTTKVIQGALERSNVGPIDEMVEMIALQRGFEAGQKAITMQDESARQLIDRAGRIGG
jgi:flagellar basal-body rod protein FlgF